MNLGSSSLMGPHQELSITIILKSLLKHWDTSIISTRKIKEFFQHNLGWMGTELLLFCSVCLSRLRKELAKWHRTWCQGSENQDWKSSCTPYSPMIWGKLITCLYLRLLIIIKLLCNHLTQGSIIISESKSSYEY